MDAPAVSQKESPFALELSHARDAMDRLQWAVRNERVVLIPGGLEPTHQRRPIIERDGTRGPAPILTRPDDGPRRQGDLDAGEATVTIVGVVNRAVVRVIDMIIRSLRTEPQPRRRSRSRTAVTVAAPISAPVR